MDRHPWNEDFTWALPTTAPRRLDATQLAQFDRDGYVVLDGVFDTDTVAAIADEIDRFEAETDAALRRVDGGRVAIAETGAITFTVHLVAKSPRLRQFASRPEFADLCHDLVGPDVRLYWDQAVYKKPEKPRRFPWHQDNGYAFVEPQHYLTCWVALTDATLQNGCPQVAPGWHRQGTLRHHYVDPLGWECLSDPPDVRIAEVGAGGVVVFSSLTPHVTGPNTSGVPRKAYILQYAPDGARRLEGDPATGPAVGRVACDVPERQFPVLQGGEPVTAS